MSQCTDSRHKIVLPVLCGKYRKDTFANLVQFKWVFRYSPWLPCKPSCLILSWKFRSIYFGLQRWTKYVCSETLVMEEEYSVQFQILFLISLTGLQAEELSHSISKVYLLFICFCLTVYLWFLTCMEAGKLLTTFFQYQNVLSRKYFIFTYVSAHI